MDLLLILVCLQGATTVALVLLAARQSWRLKVRIALLENELMKRGLPVPGEEPRA